MQITYHGHSCFELVNEKNILIDPFLSGNPSYSGADVKPDIIAVTHGHSDHLGDTADIASRTDATVVCNHEIAKYLQSEGVMAEGMNIGGALEIDDVTFAMTEARHSSSIDDKHAGGTAAGFVISENGKDGDSDGSIVYHAGDTGIFTDMELIADLHTPDICMLPIGGRYTMNPEDAAIAASWIGADIVIPMHYNTFDAIKQDPVEFVEMVENLCESEVIIMKPSETIDI